MAVVVGSYVVGSLVDGGTITITHGSLSILNPKVVSQFAVMRVVHGQLSWTGVVDAGTLDAHHSAVTSGIPRGAALQRRLLPCLPGYTPLLIASDCGSRFAKRPKSG